MTRYVSTDEPLIMEPQNPLKSRKNVRVALGILLVVSLFFIAVIIPIKADNIIGNNYKNITVRTSVNITNSRPDVLSVRVFPETNITFNNVTLSAGSVRNINCNATIRDWNGFADVVIVNATLFDSVNAQFNSSDNNNTHYTNSSCTTNGSIDAYTGFYTCGFDVFYYANNGTWNCTVFAYDVYNKTHNATNRTIVNALYALNVTDGINYGSIAVEEFSNEATANITNFGNRPINITVQGYGAVPNDNLAMNCSLGGNITIRNQRFNITTGTFGEKYNMTSTTLSNITGLTIPKQTNESYVTNITYWQIYADSQFNPGGNCSGYIVFTAVAG